MTRSRANGEWTCECRRAIGVAGYPTCNRYDAAVRDRCLGSSSVPHPVHLGQVHQRLQDLRCKEAERWNKTTGQPCVAFKACSAREVRHRTETLFSPNAAVCVLSWSSSRAIVLSRVATSVRLAMRDFGICDDTQVSRPVHGATQAGDPVSVATSKRTSTQWEHTPRAHTLIFFARGTMAARSACTTHAHSSAGEAPPRPHLQHRVANPKRATLPLTRTRSRAGCSTHSPV